MSTFWLSMGAAFAASIISFSGIAFAIFSEEKIRSLSHYLVSFAIGALLGVSFLDIIPEALQMAEAEKVLPHVLFGIIFFFMLERFLFWYHCHEGVCEVHTFTYLILLGDFLHNFVDGIIVALSFLTDIRLGVLTTFAVLLHEIPQEIGDFSVLIHGGLSRARAFLYNFLVALSIVVGVIVTFALGPSLRPLLPFLLAMVAGNFIYIAATDLMPEFHRLTRMRHLIGHLALILIGIAVVALPDFFF